MMEKPVWRLIVKWLNNEFYIQGLRILLDLPGNEIIGSKNQNLLYLFRT